MLLLSEVEDDPIDMAKPIDSQLQSQASKPNPFKKITNRDLWYKLTMSYMAKQINGRNQVPPLGEESKY